MAVPYASHTPVAIANKLDIPPPGFMDRNGYVHIPITIAKYIDPSRKLSVVDKVRNKVSEKSDHKPKVFAMSQKDYVDYWAKDEAGEWLPTVQGPPQGRLAWLRTHVRINEEWKQYGAITDLAHGRWAGVTLSW